MQLEDLRALIAAGSLDPNKDLVWNEGMPDWISPSQVPELTTKHENSANSQQPFAYETATGALEEIPPGSDPLLPMACLKRAFDLFKKQLRPLLLTSLLYFVIIIAVGLIFTAIGEQFDLTQPIFPQITQEESYEPKPHYVYFDILSEAIQWVISTWLALGAIRIALDVVDGKQITPSQLLHSGHLLLKALAGNILYILAVAVGLLLFIVPGVYIALRYSQYMYAIVDRNLGVIESFKYSAQVTKNNLLGIFLIYLLCIAIIIAGLIALCVGVIFAYPLALLIIAVAYRWMQYGSRSIMDHPTTGTPLLAEREIPSQSPPDAEI